MIRSDPMDVSNMETAMPEELGEDHDDPNDTSEHHIDAFGKGDKEQRHYRSMVAVWRKKATRPGAALLRKAVSASSTSAAARGLTPATRRKATGRPTAKGTRARTSGRATS